MGKFRDVDRPKKYRSKPSRYGSFKGNLRRYAGTWFSHTFYFLASRSGCVSADVFIFLINDLSDECRRDPLVG